MRAKPRVGQWVCLNDEGFKQCIINSKAEAKAAQAMLVIHVVEESMTDDVDTWMIHVDGPLNEQLIDNHCVDALRTPDSSLLTYIKLPDSEFDGWTIERYDRYHKAEAYLIKKGLSSGWANGTIGSDGKGNPMLMLPDGSVEIIDIGCTPPNAGRIRTPPDKVIVAPAAPHPKPADPPDPMEGTW